MKKFFQKKSRGFSLIDVLIGTALLAIIGVAVFSALTTAIKATFEADVRTTSVSLAKSLMENVKGNLEYEFTNASNLNADYSAALSSILPIPENYKISTIDQSGNKVDNKIYGVPWNLASNSPSNLETGIQKITIIVEFKNKEVFRISDFKVNR